MEARRAEDRTDRVLGAHRDPVPRPLPRRELRDDRRAPRAAAGTLAAPQILGGPSSLWFTQIIYQAFNQAGNWARGSAYALVLLITCIIFVLFVMKLFKVKFGEIAR